MTAHSRAITQEDIDQIESDLGNIVLSVRNALYTSSDLDAASAIECVLCLRSYMWQSGHWSSWRYDVEAAITLADSHGLNDPASKLRAYLAGLLEALGDWRQVVSIANHVLMSSQDPEAMCDAHFHLGTALHNLGKPRRAMKAYEAAIQHAPDPSRRAAIEHKMSRVLKAMGRVREAERCVDQLLDFARDAGDLWFRAELLLDKVGYVRARAPENALALTDESLTIYTALGFTRGIAYAELERGRLFAILGDYPKASEYMDMAIRRFRREGYLPGQTRSYFLYGLAYLAQNSFQAAHVNFIDACKCASQNAYLRMEIAGAAGALVAAMRGGLQRSSTLHLAWHAHTFYTFALALLIHLRGPTTILRKGISWP